MYRLNNFEALYSCNSGCSILNFIRWCCCCCFVALLLFHSVVNIDYIRKVMLLFMRGKNVICFCSWHKTSKQNNQTVKTNSWKCLYLNESTFSPFEWLFFRSQAKQTLTHIHKLMKLNEFRTTESQLFCESLR